MLSGRFSFDRFVIQTDYSEWLQLRLWFILLAAIVCAILLREKGEREWEPNKNVILYLISLFILCVYMIVNISFLGNSQMGMSYLSDTLLVIASLALISILFHSESDLVVFAVAAEVIGMFLFLLCLLGFGNPDLNGIGWAPIGGPVTFYRIEFLSFCSALYLYRRTTHRSSILHLIVAALGLFSTLASLSKAAMLGAAVVILISLFWLLSKKEYRTAIVIIVLTMVVFLSFTHFKGTLMRARIDEASSNMLVRGASIWDIHSEHWAFKILRKYKSRAKIDFADLDREQQEELLAFVTLSSLSHDEKEKTKNRLLSTTYASREFASWLEYTTRVVILSDRTDRITMALRAWGLFKNNRWFGIGIGNYRFAVVNTYTKEIEVYSYPHNIVLEIAATTGAVGVLIFGGLLFLSALFLQQRLFYHMPLLFLLGYLVFVFITALYTGDNYDFRLFWYMTTMILVSFNMYDNVSVRIEND
jgi:O-antigen ligase